MGADKTLVEGAYRAAMAKVPGDYSKFYWQEMMARQSATDKWLQTGAGVMNTILTLNEQTKAREKLRKKADSNQYNKLDQAVSKTAIRLGANINGGKEEGLHKDIYNFFVDKTDGLKERMKQVIASDDTPENRKEKNSIWSELQASINTIKSITDNIFTISAMNEKKQLSVEGMGGTKALYNTTQILNMDEDWSNVTLDETEEEGLVFVVDGSGYIDPLTGKSAGWGKMRIPANKLMENIVPKAHGQETWWLKHNGANEKQVQKLGKNSKFQFQDQKDSIKINMITDEKALRDIANRPLHGSTESIRDMFLSNPEFQIQTYTNLGVELGKMVGNDDGTITDGSGGTYNDFLLPEDKEMIADALFNPVLADGSRNPHFRWDVSEDIVSDILAKQAQKRHDDLVSAVPAETVGGGGGETTYKNRKHEWRIETDDSEGEPKTVKGEIWSDDIINTQNELMTLGKTTFNSFKSDQTVLIAGQHYGYWSGSGFARVSKNDKGDVSRKQKGGIPIGGWFKTIADVLKDAGLPTTYLQYTKTASTGKEKLTW